MDWYYLGRNKKLPITSEFISEHKKKIFIIESNIFLTTGLKKEYGKDLLPKFDKNADLLSEEQLNDLEETLKSESGLTTDSYRNLYNDYIIKLLDSKSLVEIFKDKFDYSRKYFKILPIQNDIHGLTPEFQIDVLI